MFKREKTEKEIEAHTNILHVLKAIQPKLGTLETKKAQEALIEKIVKKENLSIDAVELRKRSMTTVGRHRVENGIVGAEIFTKPASEVFSKEFLDWIGFKPPRQPRKSTKEPGNQTQIVRLKINPPATPMDTASTRRSSSPQDISMQTEIEQSDLSGEADTDEESDPEPTGAGGDTEGNSEGIPPQEADSPLRRSESPASHTHDVVDEAEIPGHPAEGTLDTTSLVNADLPEQPPSIQQPEPARGEENGTTGPSKFPAEPAQDDQQAENISEEGKEVPQQVEEAQAVQLAVVEVQARLDLTMQQKEAVDEENKALKKQLHEIKMQQTSSTNQKRSFEATQMGNALMLPAKRSKVFTAQLQKDSLYEIRREMVDLSLKVKYLADCYCDSRGLEPSGPAEFLVNPGPELEELYAQFQQSEADHGWRRTIQTGHYRASSTMRSLIGAGLCQAVFRGKALWDNEAADDQTFAGLARYLLTTEDMVREAAYQRIKDEEFQTGEVARYAVLVADKLGLILRPHLTRMTAGKPKISCTEWMDSLVDITRASLIIKAKIDVYHDGELEAFWSSIGSKMNPVTTDHEGNDKHLAQEVCFVYWPGLKMKVEGGPDVVLSRDQVAAKRMLTT